MNGKLSIVTGGASGIGLATAELLAARGSAVTLADVDEDAAYKAVEAIVDNGGRAHATRCDVSVAADVRSMVEEAANAMGGITTVINVAGAQRSGAVAEFSEDDWDLMFAVNAKSCFLTTKYALPHLEQADGAAVVNIASLAALKGYAGVAAYSASKGAVVSLTRCLAIELAPQDIRVNCVCPGWVDTAFNEPAISAMGGREKQRALLEETVPLSRQAMPEELAPTIAHLAADDTSYMTGSVVVVDGGLHA